MLLTQIIARYRSLRQRSYLDQLGSYRYRYAFIGAGSHSIANLYPCIRHLNIPLSYICTRHKGNAEKMAASFIGCTGTVDITAILEDPAVKGVFVCTTPSLHPEFIRTLLAKGKSVFVEKPPASSAAELNKLISLQETGQNICMTGLQRRFSTITRLLARQHIRVATYTYRYLTGPFPEGNPVYELFIHPIDNALQLFGHARIIQIVIAESGDQRTYFLHLEHQGGIKGMIELSTAHSWSAAEEALEINTDKEILHADYPFRLTGLKKPAVMGGIPLEKIFRQPARQNIYYDNNGFAPTVTDNSLVCQGFLGEIDHFVRLVEAGRTDAYGRLDSLRETYEILDRLQSAR